MGDKILSHCDLDVYNLAFETAMTVFQLSKRFPREEVYSLTDQVRRSSRSVCANLAEAWRKRRYEAAFVSKLSDAETEAGETQVWLQFAVRCEYLSRDRFEPIYKNYESVIRMIINMINHPEHWIIGRT
jgi:four helix bundle protein